MAGLRKSRRSRRSKRKSRGISRRKQRGGATIVLNCELDKDTNMVKVEPPPGVTVDTSVAKTLTLTSTAAVTDITFAGPGGPVNPRTLGLGSGIIIEQGSAALIPKGFTSVRKLAGTQKKLNSTSPVAANSPIKIRNLEAGANSLGLPAGNTKFTITLTTV